MFYHKKIQKRMKLYKGELIIFFVSGKDAKVYNGSSPLQGGVRVSISRDLKKYIFIFSHVFTWERTY
jgi:hypothetical protein